jgi:hypothetical protein
MEIKLRKHVVNYWKLGLGLAASLASGMGAVAASAEQSTPQQIQMIKDTAGFICDTVKDAKGQKTDVELEGDIKAQVNGLVGKLADLGGSAKGKLTHEQFEGLSRDATAAALEGDRGCRERVFDKMYDRLVSNNQSDFIHNGPNAVVEDSSFSGIYIRGNVTGLDNEGTWRNNVMEDVHVSVDPRLPADFGPSIHLDNAVIHQPLPSKTVHFGTLEVTQFLSRKKPDGTFMSETVLKVPAPREIQYLMVTVLAKGLISVKFFKYARMIYETSVNGSTTRFLIDDATGTISLYANTRTAEPVDIELATDKETAAKLEIPSDGPRSPVDVQR